MSEECNCLHKKIALSCVPIPDSTSPWRLLAAALHTAQ